MNTTRDWTRFDETCARTEGILRARNALHDGALWMTVFADVAAGRYEAPDAPPPSKSARAWYDAAMEVCSREWERLTRGGVSSAEAWRQIRVRFPKEFDIYTKGIGRY